MNPNAKTRQQFDDGQCQMGVAAECKCNSEIMICVKVLPGGGHMVRALRRWVLLADTTRARVVEIVGASGEARTVANLVFRNDFKSCAGPTKTGPGSAAGDEGDPSFRFAVRVLDEISSHAAEDAFDLLVLAAPPPMLLHLHNAMPANMLTRLGPEIAGNLAHVSDSGLVHELGDQVFRLH